MVFLLDGFLNGSDGCVLSEAFFTLKTNLLFENVFYIRVVDKKDFCMWPLLTQWIVLSNFKLNLLICLIVSTVFFSNAFKVHLNILPSPFNLIVKISFSQPLWLLRFLRWCFNKSSELRSWIILDWYHDLLLTFSDSTEVKFPTLCIRYNLGQLMV